MRQYQLLKFTSIDEIWKAVDDELSALRKIENLLTYTWVLSTFILIFRSRKVTGHLGQFHSKDSIDPGAICIKRVLVAIDVVCWWNERAEREKGGN
jgi:hypothetical protein